MLGKKKHKTKSSGSSLLPRILILVGIAILVAAVLIFKNQFSRPAVPVDETPETQLDRLLSEEKPIFVFFHSTNCQSCIDMMGIVYQVYPEYEDDVALVDVNVYDTANQKLLQRAQINTIPTQVFIDASGKGTMAVGVMTTDQLRQQLQILSESGK